MMAPLGLVKLRQAFLEGLKRIHGGGSHLVFTGESAMHQAGGRFIISCLFSSDNFASFRCRTQLTLSDLLFFTVGLERISLVQQV